MIERINLIEKQPFQITYEKIVLVGFMIVLLCVISYASLVVQLKIATKEVAHYNTEIARLKAEREKLLKNAKPDQSGPINELSIIFEKSPHWGDLVKDLSRRLPDTVWLTGFTVTDKKEAPSGKGLVLAGTAKDPADLAQFLKNLKDSPFVAQATLTDSLEQAPGFTFVIDCQILSPASQ